MKISSQDKTFLKSIASKPPKLGTHRLRKGVQVEVLDVSSVAGHGLNAKTLPIVVHLVFPGTFDKSTDAQYEEWFDFCQGLSISPASGGYDSTSAEIYFSPWKK